tara:strand:+ start:126 stop:707 length:582 start_codon:yes stop_codon:yes gene_type:complete
MKKEMLLTSYNTVRDQMKPGDLIAFGGMGWLSKIIKFFTMSHVSHVGIVMDWQEHGRVMVMESTTLNGVKGVQINRLSERIRHYNGHVWWMPLNRVARKRVSIRALKTFLWTQDGKKYDTKQAIKSAIPFYTRENSDRMFCSELVAGAYKKSGIATVCNPSEMTPEDVCRLSIFAKTYYQVKMPNGEVQEALS